MRTINCPEDRTIYIAENSIDWAKLPMPTNMEDFPDEEDVDWSKKEALVVFARRENGKDRYYRCAYRPNPKLYIFLDSQDSPDNPGRVSEQDAQSDSDWELYSRTEYKK